MEKFESFVLKYMILFSERNREASEIKSQKSIPLYLTFKENYR